VLDAMFFMTNTPQAILITNKQVNITGNGTTLDGGLITRLFYLAAQAVLRLAGPLDIINGKDDGGNGGAIYISSGSSLDLFEVMFINNTAEYGGALYIADPEGGPLSVVTIDSCTFQSNNANMHGGAIYAVMAHMSVVNTNFDRGVSDAGRSGAIEMGFGSLAIRDSTISRNRGVGTGGAIYVNSIGASRDAIDVKTNVSIYNSIFDSNEANGGGGALAIVNSQTYIYNSTFTNNYAFLYFGGALRCHASELTIHSSTFANNRVFNDGGAIHATDSHLFVNATLFKNNAATLSGGGGARCGNTLTEACADGIPCLSTDDCQREGN
jgi:predicted outer membrane repeat protein